MSFCSHYSSRSVPLVLVAVLPMALDHFLS